MNWLDFILGLALGVLLPPGCWFVTVMVIEFRKASAARAESRKFARFEQALTRDWETR